MAIRGVNLKEKEEVIHPSDPGHEDHADYKAAIKADKTPEKPTVYSIGNLTADDRIEFGDMSATPTMRDGGITMDLRNTAKAYEVVRRGLKGWDNQLDAEGNVVPFKLETDTSGHGFVSTVSKECMQHLPQEIITWLSGEIQRKNGMRSALAKKSAEASQVSKDLSSVLGNATDAPMLNEPSVDAQSQPSEK